MKIHYFLNVIYKYEKNYACIILIRQNIRPCLGISTKQKDTVAGVLIVL